ncbi:MAG: autotransporter-associated beta strand repeat-containing protein, partial [Verrucomicrobiia bacterium]
MNTSAGLKRKNRNLLRRDPTQNGKSTRRALQVRCALATALFFLVLTPLAQAQSYTSTNYGNWATADNWLGSVAPTSGGNSNYIINFSVYSTNRVVYSVNNFAATNFYLNQFNFNVSSAGSNYNTILTTNGVAGTLSNYVFSRSADGSSPQINMNVWATNDIYGRFILNDTLTLGGTAGNAPNTVQSILNLRGNIGGSGGLVQTGNYMTVLYGSNTYTGGTILYDGILRLGNSNALGVASGGYSIQIYSGAALDLNGQALSHAVSAANSKTVFIASMGINSATGALFNSGSGLTSVGLRNVRLGADSAVGQVSGGRFDILGTVDGRGYSLYKIGNNQVVMSGGSGYLTNVVSLVVTGGTLSLTDNGSIRGVSVVQVVTGGTFDVWGSLTFTNALDMRGGTFGNNGSGYTMWNGPVALNGASNWIRTAPGSVFIGGGISGTGQLVKIDQHMLTLAGPNTYSGHTIITNGVLQFDNLSAMSPNTAIRISSSGVIQFGFTNLQSGLNLGLIENPNSVGTLGLTPFNEFDNIDLAAAGLSEMTIGAGYQLPSGTNFQSGLAVVSINLNNIVAFNGTITPFDGHTYRLGGGAIGGVLMITNSTTLTNFGATPGIVMIGRPAANAQTGTVLLDGANTYTGGTIINSNATLSIASDAAVGGAGRALTFSGGVLQVRGTTLTSLDNLTVNWSSNASTVGFNGGFDINNNGNTFTITDNLTGVGRLYKLGSGTLVLSGTNGLIFGMTVSAGVLRLNNSYALGVTNIVASGGEIQLGTNLAAGRQITLGSYGAYGNPALPYFNDGGVRLTSGLTATNAAVIALLAGARLNVDADSTLYQAGQINIGQGVQFFVGGYGDVIMTTNIVASTSQLVKDGAGTLTLQNRAKNTFSNLYINAGTVKLDYTAGNISNDLIFAKSVLTLGTNSFSITTGGTLNVLGPSTAVGVTQYFAGTVINAGYNKIVVSNNSGFVLLSLSNITRAVGGGALDLTLPDNGAITSLLSNNYAGILGQNGNLGSGVLLTIGGTNWAKAVYTGAGTVTNTIAGYTDFTLVASGGTINDGSNTNIRITDAGPGGNINLGAGVVNVNSLLDADTTAVVTNDLAGGTLRLGQLGG